MAVATTVFLLSSITAAYGDGTTQLEPDSTQRFRPVHISSSGSTLLANVDSLTAPAVSPDGSQVAFSGAVGDESLGLYALFTVDADGTDLAQLTPGAYGEFDPAWNPDGESIIFSQNQAGSYLISSCCRLASVDVSSGVITGITGSIGAVRPAISPDGEVIVYDNPSGIWTVPVSGGTPVLRVSTGFDAEFSPDGQSIAYVNKYAGIHYLQTKKLTSAVVTTLYSTSKTIESPAWRGGQILLLEHSGAGYEGRSSVQSRTVTISTKASSIFKVFSGRPVGLDLFNNDELFFYSTDGLFRFYNVASDASLPTPMLAGSGYTTGWDAITAVDLDGDGNDEMFFYRDDGLFRFYQVRPDGTLPIPMLAGSGYTTGWDAITAVDLDGDGNDEMFFYRDDGLFRFYQVRPDGTLPTPILAGSGYTTGWDAITAVDLNGDGHDEMFFYRDDGLYRYYNVSPSGALSSPIQAGSDYQTSWTAITAVGLDNDAADELLFYRTDGLYEYQDISFNGILGPVIRSGENYTPGWSTLASVQLDSLPR